MALEWTDLVDGQSKLYVKPINDIAHAVQADETELAKKYEMPSDGLPGSQIKTGTVGYGKLASDAKEVIEAAGEQYLPALAHEFAAENGYKAGDYATRGGYLWRFTAEHAADEPWTGDDVEKIGDEGDAVCDDLVGRYRKPPGGVPLADLAADVQEFVFGAYPTDGAADVTGFKTTLGADGLPVKAATVKQTAGTPTTWTIRRIGKNHFDRNAVTFKIGYLLNGSGEESANSSYMYSETYIPVLPNTEYVFSGIYPTGNTGTGAPVSCYRADKSFIERKSSGINTNPQFKTPPDCCYIRFNCPAARAGSGTMYSGNKIADDIDIQIEIGTVATAPAAYTQQDYTVPVTALDTPTAPTETPNTLLGDNVFLLLEQADAAATMDIATRLDPTLAYNQLRAAIVASGAT